MTALRSRMVQLPMPFMPVLGSAVISDCGVYRYSLTRSLDHLAVSDLITETGKKRHRCLFVMLNPSTADGLVNDPTIEKCIKLARAWGHQILHVANLFAFRATDPKWLRSSDRSIIGPENDAYLSALVEVADTVVLAWGNHGSLLGRDEEFLDRFDCGLRQLWCIKQNKDGSPVHPLYQRDDSALVPYVRRSE